MTIIDTNCLGWKSVTEKTFSEKFQTDPDRNIQALTQTMANEIFSKSWCEEHRITNEMHRNRLICKAIYEINKSSIPLELITSFFQTLSRPEHKLFPTAHPLFLCKCFGNYAPFSKSDLHVQLGQELTHAFEKQNDQLANQMILTAGKVDLNFIELAVRHNCQKSTETLLKTHTYTQSDLINCFYSACYNSKPECLILLLKHGANPNSSLKRNESAIHMLAANKNPDLLKAVFEHSQFKIDIDAYQSISHTPLNIAYHQGIAENFDLLLSKMSTPDVLDYQGNAIIHHMCTIFCYDDFNPKALEILVDKYGANVNIPNGEGLTPIQIALQNNWHDLTPTINKLLESGADITAPLDNNKPPVLDCIDRGLFNNIAPLFKGFPNLVAFFEVVKTDSSIFLKQIKSNITFYLKPGDETANPLDIALLLQDLELTTAICQTLSEQELKICYEKTKKRFPGSDLDILDL